MKTTVFAATTIVCFSTGVLAAASLAIQAPAPPPAADAAVSETETAKRAIRPEDYAKWESLGGAGTLSADGKWLAYTIRRQDGNMDLRLRMLATDSTETIEHGLAPSFSEDSNWLAYRVGVDAEKREQLQKSGKPVPVTYVLRNLVTGEKDEFEKVRGVSFSDNSAFAILRLEDAIILHDLAERTNTTFGNVNSHAFNEDATLLAMLIRTTDDLGNGVQVYSPKTGVLRTLDSKKAVYRAMTWREDSDDLAVLREMEHEDDEDVSHHILAWKNLSKKSSRTRVFDHLEADGFSEEHYLSQNGGLRWSDDGETLFFGVKAWEKKPKALTEDADADSDDHEGDAGDATPAASESNGAGESDSRRQRRGRRQRGSDAPPPSVQPQPDGADGPAPPPAPPAPPAVEEEKDEEKPADPPAKKEEGKTLRNSLKDPSNVEVWHAADIDIIPLQKRRASRDQRRTMAAAWWLGDGSYVQLADEMTEGTQILEGHKKALSLDNSPYEELKKFGPTLYDLSLVDIKTGERTHILDRVKYALGSGPGSRYIAYVRDGHIWSYDTKSGEHNNLTDDVDVPFINQENSTLTDEKSPYGIAGWSDDGSMLFLYDRYDIWRFSANDSGHARLTDGRDDHVRHRRVVLDREEEEFIDPDAVMMVSMYGDRSKKSGYGRLHPDDGVEPLVWKDMTIRSLTKAKDAEIYTWSEQAFNDSPDIMTSDQRFESPRQVTATNPFQDDYLWGRSELINYTNDHGEELQGALFYPANYEPGKQYPMIVYIYELRSQVLHNYSVPSETHPYNPAVYSAEGYFVFQPDIVYRPQNPGLSAVECVVPAVEAALDTGMIDEDRVGLIGHSWGAYQTAFIVTQTDLFAAGIAGAPLTNMMSMSMSIYWNSGQTDAWIFHESQGRMDKPFWQDVDTYIKNSPIFSIDQLETPLMIAFGDDDGAVDFNQGVEMYNAARLAGKPFVMLVYPGENHSLRNEANQVDYHYRVLEWFGHYLQDDEPRSWITEGQSWLDRQKEIEDKNGSSRGRR